MSPVVRTNVQLSEHTTLRLGGPAARLVEVTTDDEVIAAVADIDRAGDPLLVLGGGSNLVIAGEGFAGTVVKIETSGLLVGASDGDPRVELTVAAGEDWDRLVAWSVSEGLSGLECLSGIPGLVGATPIQNVGAYGQEVAQTITSVRAFDRLTGQVVTLAQAECGFGYRTSAFKRSAAASPSGAGRYVVMSASFRLTRSPLSEPIRYLELASVLGVGLGERVPLAEARTAVLALRRRKGMVLDDSDPDTRSAGSFFTNPVLDAGRLADLQRRVTPGTQIPRYPAGDGLVKVPAAWLIEQAGFAKGHADAGGARVSTKHTLALTNPGGATTASLMALADQITVGVRNSFGIELTMEPVVIGHIR